MRNPIRRSRNIGKTQGGRVKGGRAREKLSRIFTQDVWTKLSEQEGKWRVLRENPSSGYFHPCSGEEYLRVLERLPEKQTSGVKAIVLRRSPKLDLALGVEACKIYRCVVMNSFPRTMEMAFGSPLQRTTMRHYAPWCRNWLESKDGNAYFLQWSREEVRRYYLYHLFLHEIGHLNQPVSYSWRRGEEFAEDFALEWARRLGELPMDYDSAEKRLWEELEEGSDGSPSEPSAR
jgi:hypothetical protein